MTVVNVLEVTEPLDIVPAKFLTVKLTGSFSAVVIISERLFLSLKGNAPIIWELADVLQPSKYDNMPLLIIILL